jgi:hypothetical protein
VGRELGVPSLQPGEILPWLFQDYDDLTGVLQFSMAERGTAPSDSAGRSMVRAFLRVVGGVLALVEGMELPGRAEAGVNHGTTFFFALIHPKS